MLPFALPTLVKFGVVAIAISGAVVYSVSAIRSYGQEQYDRAKAEDAVEYVKASLKYRKELEDKLIGAMNAAKEREKILAENADSARISANRLRDKLEAIRSSLPALASDAVRRYADTATVLLNGCTEKYRELGASADKLYSDKITLIEAWPKQTQGQHSNKED
tara:strand:+ start:4318 stop:4809 length:492 start_codon:yes stop_codon:yes gene_type:complete